jgi:hypothetical protein
VTAATRIRIDLLDGPQLRCAWCGEWWPLAAEFWTLRNFSRCAACLREKSRLEQALRRIDPEYRRHEVEKSRRYRGAIRRWHPDLLAAYDSERRARRRAYLAEYRASRTEAGEYPCACGSVLRVASERDGPRVMRAHQATLGHERWRRRSAA